MLQLMIRTKKTRGTILSLMAYGKIVRDLKNIHSSIFFFFPSYQIGGGERVHADIMALVSDQNPTCFITETPNDKGFKEDFYKAANVIELKRWADKKAFIPIMAKRIAKVINKQYRPVVFGCNASFMYTLTPYLDKNVTVIDLTHAFTPNLMGMEFYSLPFVDRIDQRIVIGNKTRNDYANLYREHGIPRSYMDRFKIIPNQIKAPDTYLKENLKLPLNVIFVSRNSPEKRPEVFLAIAKKCHELTLPTTFTMVGDFEEYQEEHGNYIEFTGPINDKAELNKIYKKSDIILITSVLEGFPMVLLEGMAHGVVPISTAVGEIPFLISENFKTGYLVDDADEKDKLVDSFVNLLRMCTENLETLHEFSKNAYALTKEEFSAEKFAESYRNLFTPHFKI